LLDGPRTLWIATQILPLEQEVRRWLRRHVRTLSAEDSDDLIQEAYARVWRSDISKIASARGYFYVTLRNLLTEHARRARIVPMERLGEIEVLRIPSEEPGPERRVSARQSVERLERIVEALPEQAKTAFQLQKFRGLSRQEIAVEMNISEKTVEKHLATALMRVLEAMKDEAFEAPSESAKASKRDKQQD
jgi:RNA polymerase sigma-70 factor (ECF subfamily)